MAIFGKFKRSAKELGSLRCLVVTAMLIALDLALKLATTLEISDELKLNFAFVAVASIGMLFGPTVAGLACVVTDVIGYFLRPTGGAFNPMFVLIEVMGGIIYGLFLYEMTPVKPELSGFKAFFKSIGSNWSSALRIVLAKITVAVVCNLFMTPMALTITKTMEAGVYNAGVFWTGFFTRVGTRLIKNAIEVPVHCLILLLTLFPVMAAYRSIFKKRLTNG